MTVINIRCIYDASDTTILGCKETGNTQPAVSGPTYFLLPRYNMRARRSQPLASPARARAHGKSGTVLGSYCLCYSYARSAWLLGSGFLIRPGLAAMHSRYVPGSAYICKSAGRQAGDHRCRQAGREPTLAHWAGPLISRPLVCTPPSSWVSARHPDPDLMVQKARLGTPGTDAIEQRAAGQSHRKPTSTNRTSS